MASVRFEGLPDYVALGDALAGTLVLEAEGEVRATDLQLFLHGAETSQITVGGGKNRQVHVQRAPFLELVSSFHDALPFRDADHVSAGTYRFPFQFNVPATGQPSLATVDRPRTRGRLAGQPDGMFVEYELEARLKVPWWMDELDREVVPAFSPRRVLGAIAPFSSAQDPDRPSFQVSVQAPALLPGSAVTGQYVIENPRGKTIEGLTVTLLRHVEHTATGTSSVREGPAFPTTVPLGGRDPHFEGTFQVTIPNTADTTGPFTGQLYRTYWIARVELVVELGFNVRVDAVFTPA